MTNADFDTKRDLAAFRDAGVLRLSEVIEHADIHRLKTHFWDEVDQQFDIRLDDTESWFANPYNPAGGSRAKRLSGMNPLMDALRKADRFAPIEASIQRQIDALFGADRWTPLDRWYSLLTFPGTESDWTVPNDSWHNDEPVVVGDSEPWSIFVFVFLDRVEREMGPTLAITGSHRRGEIIAQAKGISNEREIHAFDHVNSGLFSDPTEPRLLQVGDLLPELTATDEWFEGILCEEVDPHRTDRLMKTGIVHNSTERSTIENRVVDLSADAGDIILFDPRCLHSYSANVSSLPRQVLRIDFRRTAP